MKVNSTAVLCSADDLWLVLVKTSNLLQNRGCRRSGGLPAGRVLQAGGRAAAAQPGAGRRAARVRVARARQGSRRRLAGLHDHHIRHGGMREAQSGARQRVSGGGSRAAGWPLGVHGALRLFASASSGTAGMAWWGTQPCQPILKTCGQQGGGPTHGCGSRGLCGIRLTRGLLHG